MNNVTKKVLFSSAILNIVLSPVSVFAITLPAQPTGVPSDVNTALSNIISGVIGFIAVVSVLYLIYGGILYLTSSGEDKKVEDAKNTITYALIGLVITALAYAIVKLVIGCIG